MEELAHLATIMASFAALAAPPAIVAGVVPRVVPLRAFVLGLSSRLFLRAKRVLQRTQEVALLRKAMTTEQQEMYTIVAGPKGVGKTCVVQTATEKMYGVVSVNVQPGLPQKEILSDVFIAITRCNPRTVELSASTRRVLWWHRLIFRTPAIVVLNAAERKPTQAFADLDCAARILADGYGLRVVIDASDNSLPEFAKPTKREDVIEVGPMSRDVLESVPDLAELLSALKAADLADVVWACVGGVPADYL
jgi:hypothetical protein